MKKEIIEGLYETFELRERQGLGGMKFKFVPSNSVIDRINRLFGGNWSTSVITQERVTDADAVVVRVTVSVFDEDTGHRFSHDGYGSSSIMRYTGGEKKGEIIDIGNAYKSAEAKAIKNACSRWGVGLYLESNPYDEEYTEKPESTEPNKAPVVPDVKPTIPNIPPTGNLPKNTVSTGPTPPPFPVSNTPKHVDKTGPFKENSATVEHRTTPSITKEVGAGKITDVQKVAVQGLLQIKKDSFMGIPENEHFTKLATDALGRTDNLPKRVEDLTYQDAVTIIKYGNDIDRK